MGSLMENSPSAASCLKVSYIQGAVIIVCEWHLATVFDGATVNVLRSTVEECIYQKNSITAVFLFVAGKAFVDIPMPIWARPNVKAGVNKIADKDTKPDSLDETSAIQASLIKALLLEMSWLPQPLVGLADGRICNIGTNLLGACDHIIATNTTEFQLGASNGLPVAVGTQRAKQVGFLSQIVEGEAQLFEECDLMLKKFACSSPYAVKQMLPQMRISLASLIELSYAKKLEDPVPQAPIHCENVWQQPPVPSQMFRNPLEPMMSVPPPPPPLPPAKPIRQQPVQPMAQANTGQTPAVGACKLNARRGVQRKKDMATQYFTRDGPITSLMICNIPCRITQQELVEVIDSMGFYGKFDFVYLPTAGHSSTASTSNLGYGFVNFIEVESAACFHQRFNNFQFKGTGSNKVCTVQPAFIQGLAENVHNFSNSTARKHKNPGPFVRLLDGKAPTKDMASPFGTAVCGIATI